MDPKDKKITIIILIIAAIMLIGCFLISAFAAGLFVLTRNTSVNSIGIIGEDTLVEETIEETAEITEPEEPTTQEEDQLTEGRLLTPKQEKIVNSAQEIRGLSAKSTVSPVYKKQEELRQYLADELYEDIEAQDFADDHDLLSILGFIPEGFDLEQFYLDFYSEQIAGFYDTETREMYLIEENSGAQNNQTLAHEYIHFLQFDNFDFEGKLGYSDAACENNDEYCIALQAVIEGDATLAQALISDEQNLQEEPVDKETQASFDAAPKYFQESILFPYTYGFDFVYTHYLKGGFDAVDELYNNPPVSAEQIMHPERYPDDQPAQILIEPFQNLLAETCDPVLDNTLNEADLLWLLNSTYDAAWRIPDKKAQTAAEGWGGGHFQFSRCDGKPFFFSKTSWDSVQDAGEFTEALTEHNNLRWGTVDAGADWSGDNGERINLIQQNDIVYFVISPDTFNTTELLDLIRTGQAM